MGMAGPALRSPPGSNRFQQDRFQHPESLFAQLHEPYEKCPVPLSRFGVLLCLSLFESIRHWYPSAALIENSSIYLQASICPYRLCQHSFHIPHFTCHHILVPGVNNTRSEEHTSELQS